MLKIKRAYEAVARSDGYRVLVDRLWPRGVSKATLALDAWEKAVAPSATLRRWYGHDPSRYAEFVKRYERELQKEAAQTVLKGLAKRARNSTVTLVAGARDLEHSNAAVLQKLVGKSRRRPAAHARA